MNLPLAPVEELLAARCGRRATTDEVAEACSCSARSIIRRRTAGVTVWEADRIAVSWGMHPVNVWGQAWVDALVAA